MTKAKLSHAQIMQNYLWGMGTPLYMALALYWYISLCVYTWSKYKRLPGKPVSIALFGVDPEQGLEALKDHNLRYAYGLLQWAIIDNQVGLLLYVMVSKASFDYVDNVLHSYGGAYEVITNEGSKRGQKIRRPYSQRNPRRSHPATKLGKTYRG